jgi:hypothetical protein
MESLFVPPHIPREVFEKSNNYLWFFILEFDNFLLIFFFLTVKKRKKNVVAYVDELFKKVDEEIQCN